MCIVIDPKFYKNGSSSFDCGNVVLTDKLQVGVHIGCSAVDNAVDAFVRMFVNCAGISREFTSDYFTMYDGKLFAFMITIPISNYGTGSYRIEVVRVEDMYSGATRCEKRP